MRSRQIIRIILGPLMFPNSSGLLTQSKMIDSCMCQSIYLDICFYHYSKSDIRGPRRRYTYWTHIPLHCHEHAVVFCNRLRNGLLPLYHAMFVKITGHQLLYIQLLLNPLRQLKQLTAALLRILSNRNTATDGSWEFVYWHVAPPSRIIGIIDPSCDKYFTGACVLISTGK